MSRKSKLKWTQQMNKDVLECKRKAQELAASENAPCNRNGRKKGYIKIMTELWNEKGYGNLALKSQNLRDQAARLEKNQQYAATGRTVIDKSALDGSQSGFYIDYNKNSNERIESSARQNNGVQQSQNANQSISNLQSSGEHDLQLMALRYTSEQPGKLPDYKEFNDPSTFEWGQNSDGKTIKVSSSSIDSAYDEISKWRKNTFLIPYGKIGREFIDKFTEYINAWNKESEMQHIALKAAIVLLAVCLQKPSPKSKSKDHQECLLKRLTLWKEGKIDKLMREGRAIQKSLGNSRRASPPNTAKVFVNLVMNGQINSALRYLSDNQGGGVLPLDDEVMRQLKEKHPNPQEACLGSLLFGPMEDIPDLIYQQVNGEMARNAALRTKGSGGPSGVDSNGFRRILGSKSFKKSGIELCEAIATMTRRLCTEYIDPVGVEAILANRLIPLDKGEGAVRPIGVGEVIRRVMGKCVMQATKPDVIDASGSLQMCAGHKSGSEAAIHAMRNIFDADTTDAVLLVDASNAFNSLNRAAALHNIQVLCPSLATYVINTYRRPARLFITGGEEITSAEGTTQGDPIAMSLYALSLQPLITQLHVSTEAKQCWFADDATGAGLLQDVRIWWDELSDNGPALGYFPKAEKCWLVVKPDRKQ